jgi:hypothetical protein
MTVCACIAVGCIWAFGGFVPEACINGAMGDNFAYRTMWCVLEMPMAACSNSDSQCMLAYVCRV